ncbi:MULTISPECIES: hypothetical protein [unclassified Streptomyces]|uniref:hypothetical protein n=1 Tax=unclassified Streptomyces TaxID=2593676 RepID=UPI0022B66AC5|nr:MULTISPECIES: hypothetical protein [unclassified Streptomyces]MCZ7416136.1 hypothetical protein [Streptomyces sp. WMMC897]MCZ7434056.1 hypothetical protein [Streptomyces sp. WMMC1477]
MPDVNEPKPEEPQAAAPQEEEAEVEAHSVRNLQGMEGEKIEDPAADSNVSLLLC